MMDLFKHYANHVSLWCCRAEDSTQRMAVCQRNQLTVDYKVSVISVFLIEHFDDVRFHFPTTPAITWVSLPQNVEV